MIIKKLFSNDAVSLILAYKYLLTKGKKPEKPLAFYLAQAGAKQADKARYQENYETRLLLRKK